MPAQSPRSRPDSTVPGHPSAERTAPGPDVQEEPAPQLGLSLTHVIAAALAAITATVAASFLGVTGTVVGAAIASVMSVVGTAVYGHSLRRTGVRVRETRARITGAAPVPAVRRGVDAPPVLPSANGWSQPALHGARRRDVRDREGARPGTTRSPVRRLAFGAVTLFVAVLAVVTGVEAVAGRPLSDLVRGDSGGGTTLFGGHGSNGSHSPSTPRSGASSSSSSAHRPGTHPSSTASHPGTATVTVTPSTVTETPSTVTESPTVTRTSTTTSSGSASASDPASGDASDTGTPSDTTTTSRAAAP